MEREQRRSKRRVARGIGLSLRPLNPDVWFRFWNANDCVLKDISLVGVGVTFKERVPLGSRLSLDLRLGSSQKSIRIFGKVQWIIPQDDNSYRAGVSFSWWHDDQDKNSVSRYMETLPVLN